MTQNQIAFWTLQEQKAHNARADTEAQRANLAREAETNRANLAKESENYRSNVARERQALLDYEEKSRSNRANETQKLHEAEETRRHNAAQELLQSQKQREERRANLVGENLQFTRNVISGREQVEQARSNLARETETQRSNKASEAQKKVDSFRADTSAAYDRAFQQKQLENEQKRIEQQGVSTAANVVSNLLGRMLGGLGSSLAHR